MKPRDLVVVGRGKNRKFMPRARATQMMTDLASLVPKQLHREYDALGSNRMGKTIALVSASPTPNSLGAMAARDL